MLGGGRAPQRRTCALQFGTRALTATPSIRQDLPPEHWAQHRFGLPEARWRVLAGKSFWITGAGTGFGRSIATALAAAGSRVFLSGRRREVLESALEHMRALAVDPAGCTILPCDIRDERSVAAAAGTIAAAGDLYGLVNNAALSSPGGVRHPLSELALARWQALFDTNVTGQWLVTKAALPVMAAGPGARALFITSEAGWAFTPGHGPYNVSKAALNNLGASFAAEAADRYPGRDIQINVLVPGEARTEMNQGSSVSPYAVVPMTLALLSQPAGGANGCFFHRDGRHLPFAYAAPYPRPLL